MKSVLRLVIILAVCSAVVGSGITVAAAESVNEQLASDCGSNPSTSTSMTAAFSCSPTAVTVDTPITCSANVSASNSTIDAVQWGFGDGTTASKTIVTHRYDQLGTYTVFLSVTGTRGETTTARRTITVRAANQPPTATVSCSPDVVAVGDPVSCSATRSSDDRGIQSFDWRVGNNATERGEEVSHTYTTPGNRTVMLTVTDSGDQLHAVDDQDRPTPQLHSG